MDVHAVGDHLCCNGLFQVIKQMYMALGFTCVVTACNLCCNGLFQAIKQMYVLVLGLDVLGNPFGLLRGLSEGIEDLFYEPYQVIYLCVWLSEGSQCLLYELYHIVWLYVCLKAVSACCMNCIR